MGSTTPRVGFYMPADDGSDPINVATDLNDNLEKLDSAIGFVPATSASPPATPFDGLATYETDTGRAKFRKGGVWNYLLAAGASFLSDIWLGINQKIGLGTTSPTAAIDAIVTDSAANPIVVKFRQSSDTQPRIQIDRDGFRFGPGTAVTDVRIYRPAANQLAVVGSLSLGSDLSVTGVTALDDLNVTGDLNLDGNALGDFTITGSVLPTGVGQTKVARKLADTTRTSSTTQVDDTELFLAVDANSVYDVRALLFLTGDPAGDIQIAWTGPTGATWLRHCYGPGPASTGFTDTTIRVSAANLGVQVQYGLSSTATYVCAQETGLLITGVTAGTLTLRVNQFASNAVSSIIRAGSSLVIRKVTVL